MELDFHTPSVRWQTPHANAEVAPMNVPESVVSVCFPIRDPETKTIRICTERLPCRFSLSFDDEQALLKHTVEFKLTSGGREVVCHEVTLGECLPILEDSHMEWKSRVSTAKQDSEVHVTVPISTSRRPRPQIAKILTYRDRAVWLAHKLSLHKKAVAIGFLPPMLGTLAGVVVTSPLWVPFTLFIGIIGFPLWMVLAVVGSLLLAIAAISSVVTAKAVRSRHVKTAVRELAQSPGGQYVLFSNSGNPRLPSSAQVAEQVRLFVHDDPPRKLLVSLLVDLIGNATFVVPVLGELADLFWAPVSSAMVGAMYADSSWSVRHVAFLEEILPFTDIIPTATLAWLVENLRKDNFKNFMAKLAPSKQA